jgi:methyl-accepting chemotaxis protein
MPPQSSHEAIVPGGSDPSGAAGPSGPAEPTLERLRDALLAAGAGDFSVRLPGRRKGVAGEVERAFNALVERNGQLTAELARMGRVIGRDGRMTERASLKQAQGQWADALGAVNGLVDDLVRPTTEVARVIVAVAEGDLSQKMALTIGAAAQGASSRASARRSTQWSTSSRRSPPR